MMALRAEMKGAWEKETGCLLYNCQGMNMRHVKVRCWRYNTLDELRCRDVAIFRSEEQDDIVTWVLGTQRG